MEPSSGAGHFLEQSEENDQIDVSNDADAIIQGRIRTLVRHFQKTHQIIFLPFWRTAFSDNSLDLIASDSAEEDTTGIFPEICKFDFSKWSMPKSRKCIKRIYLKRTTVEQCNEYHKCEEICKFDFSRWSISKSRECIKRMYLKRHAIDEYKKDNTCESCGKSFANAGDLKKHINIIHEGKSGNTLQINFQTLKKIKSE